MSRRGRLLVGTSGFGYDAWKGRFYPRGLAAKDMLAYYAERFPSVEINSTFRSLLTPKTVATWTAATPESFVFALKAHMRVTHPVQLDAARKAADLFLAAAAPLGPRMGPVLIQLPKRVETDAAALAEYLDMLPTGPRYALEFTHAAWDEVRPFLAVRGIGRCVADTDEAAAPDDALDAGAFAYLRLRKSRYSAPALSAWAKRIRAALAAGRDVHVYFRHEDTAKGPRFTRALAAAVGGGTANSARRRPRRA
jgi:uncharacterized protein YecE (DUF72 family)